MYKTPKQKHPGIFSPCSTFVRTRTNKPKNEWMKRRNTKTEATRSDSFLLKSGRPHAHTLPGSLSAGCLATSQRWQRGINLLIQFSARKGNNCACQKSNWRMSRVLETDWTRHIFRFFLGLCGFLSIYLLFSFFCPPRLFSVSAPTRWKHELWSVVAGCGRISSTKLSANLDLRALNGCWQMRVCACLPASVLHLAVLCVSLPSVWAMMCVRVCVWCVSVCLSHQGYIIQPKRGALASLQHAR